MSRLAAWPYALSPEKRLRGLRLIHGCHGTWTAARSIEAAIAATSTTEMSYMDRVSQIAFNLKQNPELRGVDVDTLVGMRDVDMARGTVVALIEEAEAQKLKRFNCMLQEKYDQLNDAQFATTLVCKRCGSSEVNWEQKQTRGADESMTVFCTCASCHQRWKMS